MKDSFYGKIPKDFKVVTLGEVTTRLKSKVKDNDFKVLSAVKIGELKLSEEYFTKQVFSKNIEKYVILNKNEFAYNPARINIGSIGRNDYDFIGCVSPVYVAFKLKKVMKIF